MGGDPGRGSLAVGPPSDTVSASTMLVTATALGRLIGLAASDLLLLFG